MAPISSIRKNEIAPQELQPIVRQMTLFVALGLCCMQGTYFYLRQLYSNDQVPGFDVLSQKSCAEQPDNLKCGHAEFFAFQCVSGLTFIWCGGLSFYTWHVNKSVHQQKSPAGRLYGYTATAKWVAIINLTYQIWDFGVSLTIPEYCTPIMMTHHTVAAIVSWSALYNYQLGYYATFFLGLTEVSSISLVAMDLGEYFEPQPGTVFEFTVKTFASPSFVFLFLYYRVIRWWPTTRLLYNDIQAVCLSGQAEQLRPGRTWVLHMLLCLAVPMGILQLYWSALIIGEVKVALLA